jgi:hypothetical protein
LSLKVLLRVPVGVEEDYGVCGSEIDTLTTSTGREEEQHVVRISIELFDLLSSVVLRNGTINAANVPLAEVPGIVLQYVQLCLELGEYQHFVAPCEKSREKSIQKQHLSRGRN